MKNYYELLGLAQTAPHDEIKRAFRQQIARYHPDKVQHLGREFQEMAADRAAELTEAYRILSDEGRRREYDGAVAAAGGQASRADAPPPQQGGAPEPAAAQSGPPPPFGAGAEAGKGHQQFHHERASRDEFVLKATMSRLRQALEAVGGGYGESKVRGFDIACVPKSKLFARDTNPRLLVRFISRLDRQAAADV